MLSPPASASAASESGTDPQSPAASAAVVPPKKLLRVVRLDSRAGRKGAKTSELFMGASNLRKRLADFARNNRCGRAASIHGPLLDRRLSPEGSARPAPPVA